MLYLVLRRLPVQTPTKQVLLRTHLTGENTEAQRGSVLSSGHVAVVVSEPGLEPGGQTRAYILNH